MKTQEKHSWGELGFSLHRRGKRWFSHVRILYQVYRGNGPSGVPCRAATRGRPPLPAHRGQSTCAPASLGVWTPAALSQGGSGQEASGTLPKRAKGALAQSPLQRVPSAVATPFGSVPSVPLWGAQQGTEQSALQKHPPWGPHPSLSLPPFPQLLFLWLLHCAPHAPFSPLSSGLWFMDPTPNCQWFCLRWGSGEASRPYFLRGVETRAPVASSSLDRTCSSHTGQAGLPHTARATRGAAGGAESVGSLRNPHFLSQQMGLQSSDSL